jgi:hypothetical protein
VPIYAFCSWLSLKFYYDTKITVYLDTIRGLYVVHPPRCR